MKLKNHKSKYLECGCCGMEFKTWKGYVNQDQDAGYGICKECQGLDKEREEELIKEIIDMMLPHLKPENQKKVKSWSLEKQKEFVQFLIAKDALKWHIDK